MSHINNPFASTPQSVVQQTGNRFPDVSADAAYATSERQQHEHLQAQQQQQYLQQQQFLQSQQTGFAPQGYSQSSGFAQPSAQGGGSYLQPSQTGFVPQTGFGQHLSAQVTGYPAQQGYGGASSPQPGYGGYASSPGGGAGYTPSPQPQHFPDLDPYANLNTLQQSQQQQSQSQGQNQGGATGLQGGVPAGTSHPRQYVQEARDPLMRFDDYSWKQLLNRFDTLRESWEARKTAVINAGRQGGDPSVIEQLRKEADLNVDSIHASKFQLVEVKQGWMQSTDPASKARVREALNAGLRSIPDYPPTLGPEALGGQLHQRAYEDSRKQGIMQGYGQSPQPQQQGYGGMQAQPTGYGGMQAQPTGYGGYGGQQQQQYMQSQQTGYPQQQYAQYYG